MSEDKKELWCDRSRLEWDLLVSAGTSRTLVKRYADAEGLDMHGRPAPWSVTATFPSYIDADMVLRLLRSPTPDEGRKQE